MCKGMCMDTPKKREWERRVTEGMRGVEVGVSVLLSEKEARAYGGWLRRVGGDSVRRKEGDKVRVWRIK